ncbi:L-serine ammonia-lyase [Helicobacter sp. 16-1353]|uniref:L-serine ammonia-lyase n=1 Tax=Helicobacter sp. 16-1353 TaxID=2004996 RepID=UPI000DCB6E55|nr:L-serine ammonia-lyase [Helicobacter sp. 16-1353]RAX54238.1 L-serine ammonia-lyase [Helicobacter sp. 16-1353]
MSNLSIFKIGIGPSSSHTLGVVIAGNLFCAKARDKIKLDSLNRIKVTFYGSLSLTGKGHLSDKAIIWGLSGCKARELDSTTQESILKKALESKKLDFGGFKEIDFNYKSDLVFSKEFAPLHQNALKIEAFSIDNRILLEEIYYSIGGGFVMNEVELKKYRENPNSQEKSKNLALDFNSAKECLALCEANKWNLAELSYEYELQFHTKEEIRSYCFEIWEAMQESYYNGIHPKSLYLPGSLNLKRRAVGLSERLVMSSDPMAIIDFISLYAIAIAEENASGGRVVSAPTNGACAVVPAVMLYLKNHSVGFNDGRIMDFLLTAMLIGSLYKKNASISGAEAGCQAEIGSASSMAAAAMATSMGASAKVACNAAEIAMEHHLGLTCDPVGGLVQIPCIERNAFGAIKAISASRMAMSRKSTPIVNLDDIIKTMYETGKDMNAKYKETALGGLAKTIVC